MPAFLNFDTLIELMLAIALSSAAGFRVFVPLLVLSAAAVFGHVDLPTDFDWIESPQALGLFAIAALLEILGYAIPWFDHVLDVVATPAAILAGTVMTASLAPEMDPLVKWTLALVAGGGTAGLTKGMMNLLRGTSTAATGGLANPIFAALELLVAATLSTLAVTVPIAAGALVSGIFGFLAYKLWRFFEAYKNRTATAPKPP
ncbi:DUF4126 domain-containing protein [Altericista sp. CCNU0014]|uniref:DUF4126 domain-containing protein n=1 Tax=Altericista sp. CCNU0014 TaxID=3082949 RepID=UPI00384D5675